MAEHPHEPLRDDRMLQEAAEIAAILDGSDHTSELPMSGARRRASAQRLAAGPSPARAPTRTSPARSRAAWMLTTAIAAAACLVWVLRTQSNAPAPLPTYHVEIGGAADALGEATRERFTVRRGEPLVVVLTPEHATKPVPVEMHLRRHDARVMLAPRVDSRPEGVIVVRGIVGESLDLPIGYNIVELAVGTCVDDAPDGACRRFEIAVEVRP